MNDQHEHLWQYLCECGIKVCEVCGEEADGST